jgi:hypothetical protein
MGRLHLNKTADILLSSDAPFSDVPRKPAATDDSARTDKPKAGSRPR